MLGLVQLDISFGTVGNKKSVHISLIVLLLGGDELVVDHIECPESLEEISGCGCHHHFHEQFEF